MINRPCPLNVACVCSLGSPYENLSSEAPDPIDFISMDFYGWTPPINGGAGSFTNGGGTGGQNNWNRNHTIGTGNSTVNQQLADQAAERDSQNNAWNPPGRNPAQTVYGNDAQTVTLDCPDGTSFSYTVPAGTYTALDQVTANQRALQMAQRNAPTNQVCITKATLAGACLGEDYNDTLTATGGTLFEWGGYFWQATSGALPDGVTLDEQTGEISGTPTGTGSFAFTITVADYFFNTTSKDYTITVAEITTTTLPSGIVNTDYGTQTIAALPAGGTFALVSGALPGGLSLSTAGIITGTPAAGENGDYSLPISYTVGGVSCIRTLTLKIWDEDSGPPVASFTATRCSSGFIANLTEGYYTVVYTGGTTGILLTTGPPAHIGMAMRSTGSSCAGFINVTVAGDLEGVTQVNAVDPQAAVIAATLALNPVGQFELLAVTAISWQSYICSASPLCGYLMADFNWAAADPQYDVYRIGKP